MKRLGWKSGLLVGVAVLAAGGSFAWAAIPDSGTGTVTACYPTSGATKGALRVIDYQAGTRCGTGEALLTWPTRSFRWLGLWSGAAAYRTNDVVRYNSAAYIALKPNTNITPTNTTYWSLMVAQGVRGPTGATGPQGATGTSDVVWVKASVLGGNGQDEVDVPGKICASNYTAEPGGCTAVYPSGITITVHATTTRPVTWGGDCAGQTGAVCTLTLNGNKTVIGTFS